MIVEQDLAVVVEEGDDLLETYLAGPWIAFKEHLTPEQTKILVTGFNLIILSSTPNLGDLVEDPNLDLGPDTIVLNSLTDIIIAENLDVEGKRMNIFALLLNNIIELVIKLGITLNEDLLGLDNLLYYVRMLDLVYELEGYEDSAGILGVLEATDEPPKDRFLKVMEMYYGEEVDITDMEYLIDDVSEVTVAAMANGLRRVDFEDEALPSNIINRIMSNKDILEGTVAAEHIRDGGAIGGNLDSLLNFFSDTLSELSSKDTEEKSLLQYVKNIIGLHLISEMNDDRIRESIFNLINKQIDNFYIFSKAEDLVNKVVLKDD